MTVQPFEGRNFYFHLKRPRLPPALSSCFSSPSVFPSADCRTRFSSLPSPHQSPSSQTLVVKNIGLEPNKADGDGSNWELCIKIKVECGVWSPLPTDTSELGGGDAAAERKVTAAPIALM